LNKQFIPPRALYWDSNLMLLDQCLLPNQELWFEIRSVEELVQAIKRLAVRGAPAIGCAAAYGMVIAGKQVHGYRNWEQDLRSNAQKLCAARPTAVNLQVGVNRMLQVALANSPTCQASLTTAQNNLLNAAIDFHAEDARLCQSIGKHGQTLLKPNQCVLTHCNAGALATGGLGTALAVIYVANQMGKNIRVIADETRPLLQGARITCWELQKAGVDVRLQCDAAAASAFSDGLIDAVVVGSDRIAANGDVANKIGTYALAVLANHHKVPFYVAAPSTTIDFNCATGLDIPIEQRLASEVTKIGTQEFAPDGVSTRNPAFDVTPAELVSAIITEHGVLIDPCAQSLLAQL